MGTKRRTSVERFGAIARNAIYNEVVNSLMMRYYLQLKKQLIKKNGDWFIFNTTYMYMTRKYPSSINDPFDVQFRKIFAYLKRFGKIDDKWLQGVYVKDGEELLKWVVETKEERELSADEIERHRDLIRELEEVRDGNHQIIEEYKCGRPKKEARGEQAEVPKEQQDPSQGLFIQGMEGIEGCILQEKPIM